MLPPEAPPINDKIFEYIASQEGNFIRFVADEFNNEVAQGSLSCKFSSELFHDVYQSYLWDIERLNKDMKSSSPNHYKLSGFLAYWLRRSSPVIGWDDQGKNDFEFPEKGEVRRMRDFIFDYGRTYLAFSLGHKICLFFEKNRCDASGKLPRPIDEDYLRTVCYFMKYKNVSPHALGLIYRSLFFV